MTLTYTAGERADMGERPFCSCVVCVPHAQRLLALAPSLRRPAHLDASTAVLLGALLRALVISALLDLATWWQPGILPGRETS